MPDQLYFALRVDQPRKIGNVAAEREQNGLIQPALGLIDRAARVCRLMAGTAHSLLFIEQQVSATLLT